MQEVVTSILEIIHLRSSESALEGLRDRIAASVDGVSGSAEVVRIYRREGFDTDLAVHIQRREASGDAARGALGLLLAEALRAYGSVSHTVWRLLP